jgi:hypothetical protein
MCILLSPSTRKSERICHNIQGKSVSFCVFRKVEETFFYELIQILCDWLMQGQVGEDLKTHPICIR